ncbi:MAG: AarF/ABC1/UbiB kinase family protein [Betaproteobacteria bacterium]|nr:AarF/ABC1/UbiB kinase family protein [Betaproteobacteria bacterium]
MTEHVLPLGNLRRARAILGVLARHGWGRTIERLRLKLHLPPAAAQEGAPAAPSDAVWLRLALEELGPTFVKFGQLLSVRRDLFSDDVVAELEKLQDAVAPFPAQEARRMVEQELGQPLAESFAKWEDAPLAAASIAQAHAATLADGTPVVVKVQRPGIEQTIHADLEILFACARLLAEHVPESRRYDPVGLAEEFADTIVKELDFRLEGQNAERFRQNFAEDPAVYVPRIFWELSTRRVLTMEHSAGSRIDAVHPEDPAARARLAGELARLFLAQLFEHGFFHGDPHPGNVFVLEDGRLCFHDFGIVGRLTPRDQENLRELVLAVVTRDAEALAALYFDLGIAAASVDERAFARDLGKSLEQYYAASARAYSFGEILRQFVRLGQRYQIRLPREWLLVMKAFMVVEAQASALDPAFDMAGALQRYTPRLLGRDLLPELSGMSALVKGYRAAGMLRLLALRLPQLLAKGLQQLEKGELALRVRHERIEELTRHLERATNRLSFSLVIAAIVIASAILTGTHIGAHVEGVPLVGLLGYGIAGVLGLWWAIAILRSGRL